MDPLKIPFISVILPCYNEEAILEANVGTIRNYLEARKDRYKWEIVIINDGSKDKTGEIANRLGKENPSIRVIHHHTNMNLGNALQTGFCNSNGDIIVVLDVDLSYSVDHIESMVDKMVETSADIVVASPYMKGGTVKEVPFMRLIMSKWVNKLMSVAAQEKHYTFTGMVRAYRKDFIRNVNLKTTDYEINPEIMYKAMILRARIVEVPACLDWTEQNKFKGKRTSSLRVIRGLFSGLMSAFIFRPYFFFIFIGTVLMALSLYQLIWLFADTLSTLSELHAQNISVEYPFSYSLAQQFREHPQTFLVGGITLLASIQFLSLGFLSLQSKRYFDELFHLGTALKKQNHKESQV